MQWRNSERRYGAISKGFHWGVGLLIVGMIALGLYMEDMHGPDKLKTYAFHKATGLVILGLVILRINWKLSQQSPLLPASLSKPHVIGARLAHFALYLCIFLMPLSGWLMSSAAGFPVSIYGWFVMPDLIGPDKPTARFMHKAHGILADALIILISLHVLAALLHHFVYKNNVLRTMFPFVEPRKDRE